MYSIKPSNLQFRRMRNVVIASTHLVSILRKYQLFICEPPELEIEKSPPRTARFELEGIRSAIVIARAKLEKGKCRS